MYSSKNQREELQVCEPYFFLSNSYSSCSELRIAMHVNPKLPRRREVGERAALRQTFSAAATGRFIEESSEKSGS